MQVPDSPGRRPGVEARVAQAESAVAEFLGGFQTIEFNFGNTSFFKMQAPSGWWKTPSLPTQEHDYEKLAFF